MTIRRLVTLAALAASAAAPALAQGAPPKLVVAISVDQFSADLFQQYRKDYDGGLQRLSDEGVVFPAGYQGHNATETCPGHSTILTGSRPSRTGIIANNWFNPSATRPDKGVYCSEDPRVAGSSSKGGEYTVSPYLLRVPALGDRMKRANPASKVAVVAGKDRAAIMMGGYQPDQRWWWDHDVRGFVNPGATVPESVAAANAAVTDALSRPRSPRDLPRLCQAHSRAVPIMGGGKPVGDGRFARGAGDKSGFRASPDFDRTVLDLGAAMRREMHLGEGNATDLLVLGLSATDYVGHTFGTEGSEMCIQLTALDNALGEFFRDLDATGIDYLVMLTADHGGHDIPERSRDHAIGDAVRVDPALNAGTPDKPGPMGESLMKTLKLARSPLYSDGAFGDFYIERTLPAAQRTRVLRAAVAAYRRHPQVAAVFTKAELTAVPAPSGAPDTWSLIERAKASFDAERSGDFVVLLKPRVTPISDTSRGYTSTHGSPWDYDRKVPIVFWRKGMTPFEQTLAVETADILPTIAALINVPIAPGTIDGRCLDLDEGPASTCTK